jgi:hypothetical protein
LPNSEYKVKRYEKFKATALESFQPPPVDEEVSSNFSVLKQEHEKIRAEFEKESKELSEKRIGLAKTRDTLEAQKIVFDKELEELAKKRVNHKIESQKFELEIANFEKEKNEFVQRRSLYLGELQQFNLTRIQLEKKRKILYSDSLKLQTGLMDFKNERARFEALQKENRTWEMRLLNESKRLDKLEAQLRERKYLAYLNKWVAIAIIIISAALTIHLIIFALQRIFKGTRKSGL